VPHDKSRRAAFSLQNANHSWLGAVTLAAAIGIAYFVAARLGLTLRTDGLAVFWPAAGIAVGALIILGPNARLPVSVGAMLATVVANIMVGRNIWVAITFGLLNAAEANVTAWLIWRWFGSAFKLDDVRQVLGFMVASAAGGAVTALGSATVIGALQAMASPLSVWRVWFAACLLGSVTIAPVLIGLGDAVRNPPPRRELVEGALGLAILAALSAFLIFLQQGPWESALPVALVFPILLWVAVRCRPVFAAAAASVVALAIIWSATANMGHYGDASIPVADRILAAQTHVLAAALLALVIAALFADRRRSEAALAESHERLRLALDGAELGVWSVDPSTGSFENDARDKRIHGHHPDTPPKTLSEARSLIHPDDLTVLDAAFVASKRSGDSFKVEYRLAPMGGHRHAGRERWVAVEGTVVRGAKGRPLRLLGITRDITERKQADLALAERNAQLALAGQAALVGSYTYESDLERMTVSEGYTAMHGLPEGTTESTRSHWRARVHPEDLEQLEELRARTFREQGKVYNVEYRIVRAGGEVRWIDSRSFVSYDGDGYPRRVIGINIDVTERKRTEALLNESKTRLSDALAAGQVVAFEWDAATGRSQRSDNADRVIGFVEDGRFLSQVHVDDRDNFRTLIRGLSPGNPSYALTFRFVPSDGRQVWLEEAAKGDFDRSTGRLLRINGLTRDITERKELEDHKNTLISELDHRVKNVLAIVSTVASRTQETSSSMSEFVSALDGRIKSMATTHELLSFRRWQGIPLAELVGRELAPYATTSNTRIAGRDVVLSAEASQTLAMVFHELATNAAKFGALSAATGHVSVRWSFRQNGHAESWLSIDWEESGGPVVVPPTRSGFGTSVVRELVPYELGGSVDLVHAPEGLRCKLQIPAHWLSASTRPGDLSRDVSYAAQSASDSR
jgi:PAS domain S-box-containing protein